MESGSRAGSVPCGGGTFLCCGEVQPEVQEECGCHAPGDTPPFVNSTPHTSPFSSSQRMMCDTTLAQVFVRVISSMCHAPE